MTQPTTQPTAAAPAVALTITATPSGLVVRADGDLKADNDAARLAVSLCTLADGMVYRCQRVAVGPEIAEVIR